MDDFIDVKSLGGAISGGFFQTTSQSPEWAAAREAAEKERAHKWAQKQDQIPGQQNMADPWQHRSDGMKCRTCMWFAPKTPTLATRPDPRGALGRCRRHAPTMNGYPVVFTSDWCGDHKLDETKA